MSQALPVTLAGRGEGIGLRKRAAGGCGRRRRASHRRRLLGCAGAIAGGLLDRGLRAVGRRWSGIRILRRRLIAPFPTTGCAQRERAEERD